MRRFFLNISIVDCVVVLAILLILAAIVLPSFMGPDGRPVSASRAPQAVTLHAGQ